MPQLAVYMKVNTQNKVCRNLKNNHFKLRYAPVEKIGSIEIRITGSKGNLDLSPDNYDIKEIISVLENVENLLFPGDKRN